MGRSRRFCVYLLLLLGVLYGLLGNRYWSPGGGDDAFYLSTARSLVRGEGYRWNGMPVIVAPPVWPAVLAAAMVVSPSFAVLNLLPAIFCLAAAVVWFRVLGRFTSPERALVVALISGVLFHWYYCVFHLYSEALFYLLTAVALLLALQVNENKPGAWRIVLLVVVSGAAVATRWAGLLTILPVAGCLVYGQARARWNRQWIVAAVVALVVAGSFVGVRLALRMYALRQLTEASLIEERGWAAASLEQDSRRLHGIFRSPILEYLDRIKDSGQWATRLFWPPADRGGEHGFGVLCNLVGWVLILALILRSWVAIRQREWMWVGVLLYCAALAFGWGRPTGRYVAPVAPLLLLGIWQGIELGGSFGAFAGQKRLAKVAVVALLASIGLCNVALLGVDVWVSQSKHFASLCLAGEYAELSRAAAYVKDAGAGGSGPMAVSAYYYDAKGARRNTFAGRVLQFLTNKRILLVPPGVGCYEPDEGLTQWAADHRVRFYLCRRRRFTVRLWHFRMSWLRSDGNSQTDDWDQGYYELYEFGDGGFRRLELSMGGEALRRVPGL